ncbi:tryptophan synthase alpha chain [Catalinimonas alkaloidigena]|uniref:tryptophan synthase subunit alpha n=1 Tax=Catalinimonas alkaloidigena TaxID=1075417 RepID=UPI00240671D7|nr:tryptophan synthase subunit alpha [Catalinimonas alkaloidigena]MDF9798675.1 tryptophan synthase alpha chain [Catalinimonas alkaloidigena]
MIQTTNRIDQIFREKQGDILSVYYTAGFPGLNDTVRIAQYLEEAGADLIEIGMPFSDPLADGPTIQNSGTQALSNGMTIKKLFEQLSDIRSSVHIPIILMGYMNPVMQFGVENFCKHCQQAGVDALILPDLPMQEYLEEYKELFESYGLYNIFLISPQTSEDRIRLIDENSHGFIYMVSSASITGAKRGISEEQITYFKRIQAMKLQHPTLIGFGISNHETFSKACEHASGAIIGSAFIRVLEKSQSLQKDIAQYVKEVKGIG